MNSTRRPILSLKVHRLVPIRHRFAFRGESFGFYQALTRKYDMSALKRHAEWRSPPWGGQSIASGQEAEAQIPIAGSPANNHLGSPRGFLPGGFSNAGPLAGAVTSGTACA
jgi:hypothetical protein